MRRLVFIITLLVAGVAYAGQPTNQAEEERAIRTVLARFYAGWNAHDPDAMVSIYSEDIDHINVFGEWHKGKASIREDLVSIHSASARNSQRNYTIEKIRFLTGEVAVVQVSTVQVSSQSTAGPTLGTYVMHKRKWYVVGSQFHQRGTSRPPVQAIGSAALTVGAVARSTSSVLARRMCNQAIATNCTAAL
jgi:uncharacterized protein (TIGR02246 family)